MMVKKRAISSISFIEELKRVLKKMLLWLFFIIFVLPVIYIASLNIINPPLTPLMVQRVFQGYGYKQKWVDLKQISPYLRYAVIASEDNKFCQHSGFDFQALRSVSAKAIQGKQTAGASTISMQTSKNLLLLPQRSFIRKGFEAYYTIWLELLLSKKRIMEIYLNIIEMGRGVYGAEAGAKYYYKRSAKHLSLRQAAQLVTLLPNPLHREIYQRATKVRHVERRVRRLGGYLSCVK